MRARVFNIMQYEKHPITGEPLIDEDIIKVALAHKTIREWAYVCHDRDVYSLKDEADDTSGRIKAGDTKPRHWHIVCKCQSAVEVSTIAGWFKIPENFVDVPKGAGAFLDCVEYLTHEDDKQEKLGKRRYEDKEVTASFDFRAKLTERANKRLKYGRDLDPKEQMRYDVLYNGMTLRQCQAEDPFLYMEDLERLKKLRMEYIGSQNPPVTRINYYVTGRGGVGKGLICRAIARSLFPQYTDDEDIFFQVGAKGAAFEGYDGQPVIIWNDRRAIDLLQELNGRGNVFNVFDTHPTKQKQNIKYGSVNLCNAVNIVNSVQSYSEFLDGLAGEYKDKDGNLQEVEDKGQSYRRFPFMIVLHEEDFDMFLNKGFLDNTANFQEYMEYKNIRGNMQKIAIACGANEELAKRLQTQAVKPITDKHNEVLEKISHEAPSEAELLEMFKDVGKTPEQIKAENREAKDDNLPGQMTVDDWISSGEIDEELPFKD